MINLFKSEWTRLYSKKSTWICFISIPIMLIVFTNHYLKINATLKASNPQFIQSYKFPIEILQSYSMVVFDIISIMLIVLFVTDEFRSGAIRMVVIRPIKKINLFYAKFLVIIITLTGMLTAYFLLSYIIGFIAFKGTSSVSLNYFKHSLTGNEVVIYSLKVFLLELLALIAICSLIFFVSTISKTITIAFGANLGIIVVGFIFSPMLGLLTHKNNINLIKLQWLISIPKMQMDGIQAILGESSHLFFYGMGVLLSYGILFFLINYFIYKKSDILI